jgi:CDGSH-type Zn-finger protein
MKLGEYVIIQNHDTYNGAAGEIIKIEEDKFSVSLLREPILVVLTKDQMKWKKKCVCGHSGRAPFCDGTHSRLH